jgi:hypothetical protein
MTTIEKKSLKVGKYVSKQHVDTVIRNYKQERWVHNSERIGKEDSLSAWWSIEELEDFLAHAKEQGADGVKFYFGAYSHDYAERPEYAGRQTLVMVGTKQKVNAAGIPTNKDMYVQTERGTEFAASYNASSLCPPFCGTLESLDDLIEVGITILDKGEEGMVII